MIFPRRNDTILREIRALRKEMSTMSASVEDVTVALEGLKTDLEAKAAEAKAEFEKLEAEVAAGQPVNLDGLKALVDGIDSSVKAAVVPTA